MRFEETLQAMFDHSPALFKDRSDCLNQLFCVIGNGFEWVNGELVEESLPKPTHALQDGKAFQHNKMSLRAEARYYHEHFKIKQSDTLPGGLAQSVWPKAMEEYFSSIPDNVYHKRPRKERWYFVQKSISQNGPAQIDFYEDMAYLFQYPDDIKPDWLAGIQECRVMLKEDGIEVPIA